jgi:hypothetical protein
MTEEIRFPSSTHRLVVIGRTGSGKTQAALWHLTHRDQSLPWIIFDFKRDAMIGEVVAVAGAQEIKLTEAPPTKPGLYVVHPLPRDTDALDAFLWRVWNVGGMGLFFDEGYMVGDGEAFRAILTTGRSRHIPVIVLSQRPAWLTKFAWSEADFYQVFQLSMRDDLKKVREYGVPFDFEEERLPDFHSVYYDVARNRVVIFTPVPDATEILGSFQRTPERRARVFV